MIIQVLFLNIMKNFLLIILFTHTIPNIILSQSKNEELLYSVEFSKEHPKKFTFSKYKEGFIFRSRTIRKEKKYKHVSGR